MSEEQENNLENHPNTRFTYDVYRASNMFGCELSNVNSLLYEVYPLNFHCSLFSKYFSHILRCLSYET